MKIGLCQSDNRPQHKQHKIYKMAKYHKKCLEDGVTLNPLHKSKKCGKRPSQAGKRASEARLLPDGSENPFYRKKKPGKKTSRFMHGIFIGIDGEGEDVNGKHEYTFLAVGEQSIYNPAGLSSAQILDFLCKRREDEPKGIFCIFAGGYDANFWLKDVPRETIELILEAAGKYWIEWEGYKIMYTPRRYFSVKRYGCKESIRVWDTWGFFQGSFVNAVKKWVPGFDKLDLIIKGKSIRSHFTGSDYEFMRDYNAAEIEALELMMNKLREAMIAMGLTLKGWHGAGAVASAIYSKHDVKDHMETPPDEVYQATKHAYFGGRIEIGKFGRHVGTIHHYDINSAYPSAQVDLPSLQGGQWINRGVNFDTRTTENICISLVAWDNIVNTPFCPFAYRSKMQLKVLFPPSGLNWIWKPELDAALKWRDLQYTYWVLDVQETWEFIPANDIKPFAFIAEDYKWRQEIVAESKRTGIPNGVEMAIKLGLNSLYGKTAQRVGYDKATGRTPPYHNLVYAGYITAATRAKLFDAAMQKPWSVIAMATDGIYCTEPLDLYCPKEKELGAWEYQTHDEMVLVQSGVYFLRDGEKLSAFSRGFDRMTTQEEQRETLDMILQAWKAHKYEVYLPCTRFITLASAMIGGDWWSRWLSWYEFETDGIKGRKLAINPEGTKRTVSDSKTTPHRQMLQTMPTFNVTPYWLSDAHDIPWDEYEIDMESIVTIEHSIDSDV